ncbi:death-associated protein 1 [Chrysoperla carnea]|uniref:death-associated protein 1 n=1 Tax=Chrysoperla carnea TaxID=189513 RepID=UPI001D067705|nr:death-associated protein 1 [Chrysoperla carnea]
MADSKEECQLKAGHPPAVKAGGMRITQHKSNHKESGINEETCNLKVSCSPPKTLNISGAVPKGNADFPTEAVQSFHKDKPPVNVCVKPQTHIQQPRK